MLFSRRPPFLSADKPPQADSGLGAAFFGSVLVHVLFLLALSNAIRPMTPGVLGTLLGGKRQGLEAYLVQSANFSTSPSQDKNNQAVNPGKNAAITTVTEESKTGQGKDIKPGQAVQGIDLAGRAGILKVAPGSDQVSGRQSGFLGSPAPAGNPEGMVPLAAEWAMRRQSALRTVGLQLEFMRQAFVDQEGTSCLVQMNSISCNPPNPGLMGFLSARYTEMHLLDPSLPAMLWRSHGYGQWSFELQELEQRPSSLMDHGNRALVQHCPKCVFKSTLLDLQIA